MVPLNGTSRFRTIGPGSVGAMLGKMITCSSLFLSHISHGTQGSRLRDLILYPRRPWRLDFGNKPKAWIFIFLMIVLCLKCELSLIAGVLLLKSALSHHPICKK